MLLTLLASFVAYLVQVTGWQWISLLSISGGITYFILHYLFNSKFWKYLPIPDLDGDWEVKGKTLDRDGNTLYYWKGDWKVEQNWKKILIYQKTKSSESWSYTATISRKKGDKKKWVLAYSYNNEPLLAKNPDLQAHRGFCELEFDLYLKEGDGIYYNSRGRVTFGTMQLTKR